MERVKELLNKNNVPCGTSEIKKIEQYMDNILEYNKHINLTAIKERKEFVEKHILDSLMIAKSETFKKGERIVDVGTGAGFPGVILAICFPNKSFVLMDSVKKKLDIIEILSEKLDINNVRCVHIRAEDMGHMDEYRESFDICVSRAVANMSTLSEYCIPLVRVGGYFVPYKTLAAKDEIEDARYAIKILGGNPDISLNIIKNDGELNHTLIEIEKIKETPKVYPRLKNLPRKEPLRERS